MDYKKITLKKIRAELKRVQREGYVSKIAWTTIRDKDGNKTTLKTKITRVKPKQQKKHRI